MYNVVTLEEVKNWLYIEGKSKDDFLRELITAATAVVENYCGKRFITRRYVEDLTVTKQYQSKVYLSWYPVYKKSDGSNFTIWDDPERKFPASTEVNKEDYIVHEGIGVVEKTNGWFSRGVGVVRVDYWAGYSRFVVVQNANDRFEIVDGGTSYQIVVAPGTYIAETLAEAIQTAIADASLPNTYTVSYDHLTQRFTISSTAQFDLKFQVDKSIGGLIGFTGNREGQTSYEGDKAVTGVPADVRQAALHIINRWWRVSKHGEGNFDLVREMMKDGGTKEYDRGKFPIGVPEMLDKYKRAFL